MNLNFKTDVETTRKIKLTKDQVKELLIEAAGLKGAPGVSVYFSCRGGDDGYGGYDPMDLSSVEITQTTRSSS